MEISIDRDSSEPIFRQVVREIQDLIRSGSLPEGFRLPPERRLANSLGVNRSTILNAYRELKALGLVDAHVGRGTAVLRAPAPVPDAIGVPWRQLFRESVARSHDPIIADLLALTEREDVISFSIGLPAPELLPLDTFGEYTAELIREVGAPLLLHCPTEGHTPLRETLAQWVAARGIRARASEVLVVSGSQQGLDLVARVFIDPGDVVVVEEPTYIGALQSFRVAGAKIIGIPVDENGMRTDILASILERERPKLIYTLPTYQNPSGVVMSVERRRHLLEIASRWHLPILEDDPYSELRYDGEPLPSLKALDDNDLVLYQSTFSKALFPGLRIGYLVAPPVVLRQLALAKQGADLHANSFSQYLLERFVRDGHFAAHIENSKTVYRRRRDRMAAALLRDPSVGLEFAVPAGGFYIWCRLPEGVEQSALLANAAARGVVFLPGRACYPTEPTENCIRLNFSHASEAAIEVGIERLLESVREARVWGLVKRPDGAATSPVV
ncbi:MAG: PLP-dependent aminotransferase family protein [Acidobacteriota bacterium]|nr:PLP-dependent aminotransferase family protein [Acidobacteriota bacterium]